MLNHLSYMSLALTLAEKGRLRVSPNPMVGCVIVKDDQIVGQGWHAFFGDHHAEIHALHQAGIAAKNATLYVTLEPCCHDGKTPPCTEALIQAGIKEIYIACQDPNPIVSGKSIGILKQAGMTVHIGLLSEQAQKLNHVFFYYMQHQRPFVIAKWAMSLDGQTITHPHDNKQISGQASMRHLHQTRAQTDAILIGARTLLQDNPALTARDEHNELFPKQPVRIILWGQHPIKNIDLTGLTLFSARSLQTSKVIIAMTEKSWEINKKLKNNINNINNTEILIIPEITINHRYYIHLATLLAVLAQKNISSLLVEGGQTTHAHFFEQQLVNQVQVYLAPVIISHFDQKITLKTMQNTVLNNDLLLISDM